ncbi:MAG: substrate-binding domain-containing protein [Treponema sp.]|jgi:ribose transport system substrate-binding protein|nr:substrate-binding domain-containing protein [Treponema sp.]
MKKATIFVVALLLAVLTVPLFAGGGGQKTADGQKQLSFTFVLPMVPNEIWVVAKEGFETRCNELGVKPVVVMPSTPNDVNQMNNLMETAIAEGAAGVITQPTNPEGMQSAFDKLTKAGIPFALVNSDAPNSGRIISVGTGGSVGDTAGEYIVKKLGNQEIRYITALWSLTASLAIDIHNHYIDSFKKAPGGAREVVLLETQSDKLHITSEYQNAFATYPNANVAVNVCGFGAAGAAKAATEAGIGPDKIFIMGIDDIQETMDGIRSGRIQATMTQNFYRMGYEAADALYQKIVNGKDPARTVVDSGSMVVDMTNINSYKQDMRNPAAWK